MSGARGRADDDDDRRHRAAHAHAERKRSDGDNKIVCLKTDDVSTTADSADVLLPNNGIGRSRTKNGDVSGPSGTRIAAGLTIAGRGLFGQPMMMRKKKTAASKLPSSQKRKFEQREMRATIRMAIIIACFCGMWLGFFTMYFVRGFCPHCVIPRELDALFFWLGYSNSSVNPILYTIFNEEFRKAFQKILGCYRKAGRYGRH